MRKSFGCAFEVYNKEFTFTSTGASNHLNGSVFDGHGPPTYKIQAETFHRISFPLPEDPGAHLYSQLYIYHSAKALRYRKDNIRRTAPKTMTLLQTVLISDNPFVDTYKQVHEFGFASSLLVTIGTVAGKVGATTTCPTRAGS